MKKASSIIYGSRIYKGKLFWKKEYISFCSRHRYYDKDCDICNSGYWTNVWTSKLFDFIYRISPKLWERLINRKKYLK